MVIWMEQTKTTQDKCLNPTRTSVKKSLEWMFKFFCDSSIEMQYTENLDVPLLSLIEKASIENNPMNRNPTKFI